MKNISRSAKKHESSREHIKNFVGLKRLQQNRESIRDALQVNARLNKIIYNENVRKNRLLMTYLIDTTILLGRQELSFRGHDETSESINCGNYKEIFNCLIKRNVELTEHLSKMSHIFTGQSKIIQNELISCIEEYLKEHISREICNSSFFALTADDTTDITEKSQCAITIRYVTGEC